MPLLSIQNVRIAGLAAAIPPLEQRSWEDLGPASALSQNARKRNITPCRRKAARELCQSDFCAEAAKKLMAGLGWEFGGIDAVVMATTTPDYPIPPTAIILQDRLGVPKTSVAFDLPSGSTGFLHGLQVAASLVSMGYLKKALLFSGEVNKTLDESTFDQAHRMFHGDNGCVCALEYRQGSPALVFDCGGDGSASHSFYMPAGGHRVPVTASMFADDESARIANDCVLDCAKVDAITQRELPACARSVLKASGKTVADLDGCYFNPMTPSLAASLRKDLGVPRDLFYNLREEFGPGNSGSIPLAMLSSGASRLGKGSRLSLLGGSGPGVSWGCALIATDNLVCPEIIEFQTNASHVA